MLFKEYVIRKKSMKKERSILERGKEITKKGSTKKIWKEEQRK